MSRETRTIPNEVVLVGKLRKDMVANIALKDANGADRPMQDIISDVQKTFQFTRTTFEGGLTTAAKDAGFQQGQFYHIQTGDPGGEKVTLPNGKTVNRSRKTTRPGFDVIFQASRATTFEEIKQELLSGNIELVGGDPNCGKVRLSKYALFGFWDEFGVGFWYTPHFYDPKNAGKLSPLMSHPKQPDGSYSKTGVRAQTNTARHFVYEDEEDNLATLREQIISRIRPEWIIKTADNTAPVGNLTDDSVVSGPAPAVETALP